MSNMDEAAFSRAASEVPGTDHYDPQIGLTKREHAAIALRVPMSGDPELDAMILEARRMDAAEAALGWSLEAGGSMEGHKYALQVADRLISAREAK